MKEKKGNLGQLRKDITRTQIVFIISVTIFLSFGGLMINLKSINKDFNQTLQNTSELITRLYSFTRKMPQEELTVYMDSVTSSISNVDIFSIVDKNDRRIYHTNHNLINTQYDGNHPDFFNLSTYYIEDSNGPSGPQRRTYSAIYDEDGNYLGFIMTIALKTSMGNVTRQTILFFAFVTLMAILVELLVCATISKKIKKEFLSFTEDFEGTKFLVDSMRANNHDFTNKLHVILGLIQIGEYEKAQSYIQNISIIQKETVSYVMHNIQNPSLAALLIGKIARASECNVKFSFKENSKYSEDDIIIPSEALVTITGNLIDNALDSMNSSSSENKLLTVGIFTKPGELLLTVQDTGFGIPEKFKDKIFDNGFSTKGNGRGVGLFHSKQLIESLGGDVFVESQVGNGACFSVILRK